MGIHLLPSDTRRRSQGRITAGLSVFVLLCLLSSARVVMDTPRLAQPGSAPNGVAARADVRFSELRKALPQRGVVGYIGESGDSSLPEYYAAQYAVAPLVVEQSTDRQLVIGNFTSSSSPAAIANAAAKQLSLVRDFGNGVMLFAKRNGN